MGNRCIITDKDKECQVYLQWDGELYHILGFLDGVKRLYDATKYYQSRVDLFNFAVCIQNRFGRLGYNTYVMPYILKDGETVVTYDNGHYEIDFEKFEIVRLYMNIYTKNTKQTLYEEEELQEMIKQEKQERLQDIARISQQIFDVNKGIFGAVE